MIEQMYYVLSVTGADIDPLDVQRKSRSLYDKERKIAFVFDGDVSMYADVSDIVIIHTCDEPPNIKYLNYYVEEESVAEAVKILKCVGYNINSDDLPQGDAAQYYINEKASWDTHYVQAIVEYMKEEDDHIFPVNGYKGLMCENWFRMQKQGFSIVYEYNGLQCQVLHETLNGGDWGKYYSAFSKSLAVYKDKPHVTGNFGGVDLKSWSCNQKTFQKKGTLLPERHRYLEELGFFSMGSFQDVWDEKYSLLIEFVKEHDRFPEKRESYRGQRLGEWVHKQRADHSANAKRLTEERISKLDAIGLDWNPLETEWNRKYGMYLRYIEMNGGSPYISRRAEFEGERLGVWAFIQKKQQKEGKMKDSRYKKLVAVGFPFD